MLHKPCLDTLVFGDDVLGVKIQNSLTNYIKSILILYGTGLDNLHAVLIRALSINKNHQNFLPLNQLS